MPHPKYALSVVYNENYIYALGGRGYYEDLSALFSTCERYNCTT